MNILCGHHAKTSEACNWVIENYGTSTGNTTVELWVQACREYLEFLNDGAAQVSTG